MKRNLMESIAQAAQVHGGNVVSRCNEGGTVRLKIVVRKQEVKQMLAMMGSDKNNTHQASSASSSLEQRLEVMRRKHHLKKVEHLKGKWNPWRPVLKSIPEEL